MIDVSCNPGTIKTVGVSLNYILLPATMKLLGVGDGEDVEGDGEGRLWWID